MEYRVDITDRALRDLSSIYQYIKAEMSEQATAWYHGLCDAITSLEQYPNRGPIAPEDGTLRNMFYGKKPHIYRIIYAVSTSGRYSSNRRFNFPHFSVFGDRIFPAFQSSQ